MLKKTFIPVLLAIAGCTLVKAQQKSFWKDNAHRLSCDTGSYISTVIGTKNGLPSSQILCLYQQRDGQIWIGSSIGVSKFDGFNFENFLTAGNRQLGKVLAVKEDTGNKTIWVMGDAGLCFYKEGLLIPALFEDDIAVNDICFDGRHGIWLATARGPAHLDSAAFKDVLAQKKVILGTRILREWAPLAQTGKVAQKIALDADGALWFSSRRILFRYNKNGLEKKWETELESDDIESILCYNHDTVYFSAIRSGLFAYENNRLSKIPFRETISANLQQVNDHIYYLNIHGVYRFTASTHGLQFVSVIPDELNIWLSCLLVDRENNLWIGMHDDLIFQRKRKFYEYKNTNAEAGIELFCLYQKKDGTVLMGANRGRVFKMLNNKLVNYFSNNISLTERAEMKDFLEDSRGWTWYVSGFEGMKLSRGNKMESISVKEGLGNESNFFLFEDRQAGVWTGGDGFITRITADEHTGKLLFKSYSKMFPGDNMNTFLCAAEGPDGAMWFGGERGLFVLRNDSLKIYSLAAYVDHPLNISDIRKDMHNDLWIATQGDGIWQLGFQDNGSLKLKKIFTDKDALHSNIYRTLLIDRNNVVWAASYSGITRIDYTAGSQPDITNYSRSDGYFNANYQSVKLLQLQNDTIWAATSSGLLCFNPADFVKEHAKPGMVLRNVQLLSSSSEPLSYYEKPYGHGGRELELPYYHHSIAFEFSGIYFANPSALKYMYRLSGAGEEWIDIGNKRNISFQNLSPGKYRLELKSYLGSHAVSEAIAYPFSIMPPFWKTWWFITCCFAAVAAVLVFWIKKREAELHKKAAERALVQKQLNELEIKALRAQMNPHFIFNSLNSISLLVASNQNERGLQYLSRFSKLLRMVVDEHESNFISLKDEMQLLSLYLQLEALRFGETFSYSIHADEALNLDQVMLPSFLVHTAVENAIWHGLLHKDGDRKLTIEFKKNELQQLLCIIQDNGIGITAAKKMKAEKLNGTPHKEKGLLLIRERLVALRETTMRQAMLYIEELTTENAIVQGTKVTIELPIIYEA